MFVYILIDKDERADDCIIMAIAATDEDAAKQYVFENTQATEDDFENGPLEIVTTDVQNMV